MRLPNQHRRGQGTFNMTPMIDVVFLLIIFFLVSSHLAKREAQMDLPLPDAASGQERTEDGGPRLTVNVMQDGQLMLAGRVVGQMDLKRRFEEKLQEAGRDLEVVIRGHRDVPYRYVEPIMLSCVRAGIWNVTFAVYRPGDHR